MSTYPSNLRKQPLGEVSLNLQELDPGLCSAWWLLLRQAQLDMMPPDTVRPSGGLMRDCIRYELRITCSYGRDGLQTVTVHIAEG